MGRGAGALPVPADVHADELAMAAVEKPKKEKKVKKDKKDKKSKDKKDKTSSATKKRKAEAEALEDDTVAPKKARVDTQAAALVPSDSRMRSSSAMDDDMEDTDIGMGATVTDKASDNAVSSFGLSAPTVRLLKDKGIESLFDIQSATFKMLRVEKKDVIGRARTGSGKTLAFVLPIIENLVADNMCKAPVQSKPLVLCLAPTRELAQQVHRDFEWIAGGHRITTACFTGGNAKGPQYGALRRGLDVLVGTPGRIIDHLDEGGLSLAGVRFIVLDEADEMLSMGFQDAVERILGACTSPEVKQTLLFSATVPRWVKDLAKKYMRSDATVTVDTVSDDKNRTNTSITHLAIACPPTERGDTLADVVKVYTGALGKTIVFTDTKAEANELAGHEKLVNALGGVGLLHGDIAQGQREQTLAAYREGKIRVLVATDVAARGLDIKAVDLIIQTHPPTNYETYIHRSGRTGRAGLTGTCITFYGQREKYMIGLIEHKAGMKFTRANPPQPADIVKASVTDTVKKISSVHKENLALFREVARKVVESYKGTKDASDAPEIALAASLACMAGYTNERVKTRSLLTCFQGAVAVVMSGPQEFEASGHAWSTLRRFVGPEVSAEVKGMQLCKDKSMAVFDCPQRLLDSVLEAAERVPSGYTLEAPADKLPELNEAEFDLQSAMNTLNEKRSFMRGKYGRGGGGGGGGRGGGFRGGGRGGGGGRGRGGGGFRGGRGGGGFGGGFRGR